jgi:imidazolonepropionase-like amidohydrolase
MWLASPMLSGDSAPDAATAERLVREAKAAGYDLLKVLEGLSAEAYAAIVATAIEVGLPWGGHVSASYGVRGALATGQTTIDHFDDYVEAMQPPDSPAFSASGLQRREQMAIHADASMIPELARATREAGVAVVPTQIFRETFAGLHDPQMLLARAENRYMPQATVDSWYERISTNYRSADREGSRREAELRQSLLKTMNDVGVLVLMGTDAPQIFSVPGFSLHRELPLMVESGMTAYEVLRTGTVNVARYLGIEADAGTIAVGKFADLLLLEDNPLEDISAVAHNAGVMVDGRWLAPDMIAERLEEIAQKHAR